MERKSRALIWQMLTVLGVLVLFVPNRSAAQAAAQPGPQNLPARATLDEAIDLALKHNHSLQAARTTILQNQALEITANLRSNPTLNTDAQFLPFFHPNNFTNNYGDNRPDRGRNHANPDGTAGGRQDRRERQPVPAIPEFVATLNRGQATP